MAVLNHLMVVSNHDSFRIEGPRNSVRYRTGTPTLGGTRFGEPKRLLSFEPKEKGFHGMTFLAWRNAVGTASQIHRDLNHEKTGKRRTAFTEVLIPRGEAPWVPRPRFTVIQIMGKPQKATCLEA